MRGMLVSDTPPIRIRYGKRRIVDFSVMLTIFDTPWTHERYAQGYGGVEKKEEEEEEGRRNKGEEKNLLARCSCCESPVAVALRRRGG
ncbi:hypothetical protein GBA52_024637 [Prunus armeniaca]|nr:hypothetical protein GBA52_024637 [Prunus armeniaca]